MAGTTSLKRRIEAMEQADKPGNDGSAELPIIVPADALHGLYAAAMRKAGFAVMTFEQCVEEAV